jgi:glutaredoxin 3
MAKVEIYTWNTCPFCRRAKDLLDAKDVDFTEYDITGDDAAREKMVERTRGPRTVPQIFINDNHIGGCDDLHLLEEKGELNALLAQ